MWEEVYHLTRGAGSAGLDLKGKCENISSFGNNFIFHHFASLLEMDIYLTKKK